MIDKILRAAAVDLLDACRARGLRVATAESCTGGLVAAALTEIAGSSDVVECGFVVYSNTAKETMLGVPAATLKRHGAVSAETAAAMASGALKNSQADIAVAITGIAGPCAAGFSAKSAAAACANARSPRRSCCSAFWRNKQAPPACAPTLSGTRKLHAQFGLRAPNDVAEAAHLAARRQQERESFRQRIRRAQKWSQPGAAVRDVENLACGRSRAAAEIERCRTFEQLPVMTAFLSAHETGAALPVSQ
jgi:PncC family amidohydrolase